MAGTPSKFEVMASRIREVQHGQVLSALVASLRPRFAVRSLFVAPGVTLGPSVIGYYCQHQIARR
jgi:hypothetical protein